MKELLCYAFGKAWVESHTSGPSYCIWRYTDADGSTWWHWVVFFIILFVVGSFIKAGFRGGTRNENDKIIGTLNDLIPPYQAEALKNLTTNQPSDKAEREYKAFVSQIEHDGNEYKWK